MAIAPTVRPGEPSPLGRLIGLGTIPAALAGAFQDPAILQMRVLEAARNLLARAGMPAMFTGSPGVNPDRMMIEFLTRTGQMGRVVGSMGNPREYLMLLENTVRQVNPVAMMARATPVMQESPEGLRTAMLGMGTGGQLMAVLRALAAAGADLPRLLPLLMLGPDRLREIIPGAGLQMQG